MLCLKVPGDTFSYRPGQWRAGWGGPDRHTERTPGRKAAQWAEREPDNEYHVINVSDHCANLDQPDDVNGLISSFLARHLPG